MSRHIGKAAAFCGCRDGAAVKTSLIYTVIPLNVLPAPVACVAFNAWRACVACEGFVAWSACPHFAPLPATIWRCSLCLLSSILTSPHSPPLYGDVACVYCLVFSLPPLPATIWRCSLCLLSSILTSPHSPPLYGDVACVYCLVFSLPPTPRHYMEM